ncbi:MULTISPECIES: SGNH/GDSL hydrolase family protein [Prevotellaceae]|uniref:SGNH/GDSL hydrolase family protein n=1 Tax=Prevotellaceae TaxID=171552 RepID=UPI000415FA63|nr:SGNH/GDSL hydrolase family protein [Prevotella phocaeensis]
MRRIIGIIMLLLLPTAGALAKIDYEKKIFGTDSNISYTGRTERTADGTVRYDWVGTYFQTDFTGGSVAVSISDTGTSFHNLFIDGKLIKKIKVNGKEPRNVVLADGLGKGIHRLCLQKCTEGEYGCTTIYGFSLAKGGTLKAVAPKERMIEVIGDSYTCGFGTESNNANDRFQLETENCNKAYGCIIARYFNADYALIAHSGQGLIKDWGDTVQVSAQNMSTRYMQVYDNYNRKTYDFKAYRPQLVIINLGTNDFASGAIPTAEQYVGAYLKLIDTVKLHYGDIPVFCIIPHSAGLYLTACLRQLKEKTAAHNHIYVASPMPDIITQDYDLGAAWHPNYQGQRKIAMTLIPQISAIMRWQLNSYDL